ncbi:hypothetical protein BVRB_9g222680 [Beta vulgaris subsp. vulgaris]|uniref:uncharacterized protein LOC104904837 n=1 Tax=Beta vulgaris subsp. vulgaris TaxID=3555 RepID=UPI00053FE3CA|nr:uncharacterized protein LOC104904837 [Beta vulgaris subsp. vulgaris]KMT01007.1 hypothetical protein BVRB_9g222680 [Beta vulgaris subsp. vulgaris]
MVAMASLQMMKPTISPFLSSSKSMELDSRVQGNGNGICGFRRRRIGTRKMMKRVFCNLQDGDDRPTNSSNNEPPESLFMKELRRRGISPTSLLEESNRSTVEEEIIEDGADRLFSKRNAVATDSDKSLTNQREQSMALNSEGLEGLIPRAKLLLTLGGTFFLAFWPLILVTVGSFAALYLYFGSTFVHIGGKNAVDPPPYIDPYVLLQEERIIK